MPNKTALDNLAKSRAKHRRAREAPGERSRNNPWEGLEIKPHGTQVPAPRYAGRIDTGQVKMSDGSIVTKTAPVARTANKAAHKKKADEMRKKRSDRKSQR